MLKVGGVKMNKLEIKITKHFHSGGMNTYRFVINNKKKTYDANRGGTVGRSGL